MSRLALWLFVPALFAGSGMNGPASGFVWDGRTETIRPLNGIPGATLLGEPLALPFAVERAAIAARKDFALVIAKEDHRVFRVRGLREAEPAVAAIEGAVPDVSLFALSEGGTVALLYSRSEARLQVVTGLPDQPEAVAAVDTGSLGEIAFLAVDDGGSRILVGTNDVVYALSGRDSGAPPRLLARVQELSALTLLNGGKDGAFADKGANQVFHVRDLEGGAELRALAGEQDGISAPAALQGVGNLLYVANSGASNLAVFNLADGGAPEFIGLSSPPSRCERLDGDSTLVLNDAGRDPLLLLDVKRGNSVSFVPVAQ